MGGQVSWLIPLALVGLAAGLAVTLRAPRTGKTGCVCQVVQKLVTV